MPNLLAHNLIVKRLYIKEAEQDFSNRETFIQGNYDFLSLGAQGPDPLFYFGIVPFHAPHFLTAFKKLGNKIHADDGKKYFKLLLEQCYGIDDPKELSRIRSFVFGQFAHYLLDREAHPYILYRSGFDKEGRITGKYHYRHTYFESQLDVSLAKKFRMNYFLSHPADAICVDRSFLEIINKAYVPVLRKMFPDVKIPKKIYTEAILGMHGTIKFMNGNPRLKAHLVGKNSLGALALPIDKADPGVLNDEHKPWKDPVTGAERRDSFIDLHTKAYRILDDCYQDLIRYGYSYEVFSKYINGLDYYGLPLNSRWTFQEKD